MRQCVRVRGIHVQLFRKPDDRDLSGLVPIPSNLDRFIRLPGNRIRFIVLEEAISLYLDRLFPGFELLGK